MTKLLHIIFKDMIGSGRTVAKQLSDGKMIGITPKTALKEILSHSDQGDRIVFHGRKSLMDSMAFLLYNKLFRRNKIIYNPHTNLRAIFQNKLVLNFFTDTIVVFTDYNKKPLDAAGFKNVIVIPNPIPTERLECTKGMKVSQVYDFVWAGRNVPSIKRMELFIHSISRIPEARGIVLADRFESRQIEMGRNVGNRLKMIDGLNGFEFFYELQKGKAFIFTSTDAEGFPVILLEAIALGIPIVAPDSPKYREILLNKATFWKDEDDLIKIMEDIHTDSIKLEDSRRLYELYAPEKIISMYEAIA